MAIIGGIAAITIPSLMAKTQDAQLKIAFKKSFSEISQIAASIRNDNGGTLVGVFSENGSEESSMQILRPYFIKLKTCGLNDNSCWPKKIYEYDGAVSPDNGLESVLVAADGSLVVSSGTGWTHSTCTNNPDDECLGLTVDVNGFKPPNIIGKDIFLIALLANRTVPVGLTGTSYANRCGAGTSGYGCAGWVMEGKDY